MARTIGRNINFNDEAVLSDGITLNATTSTTVAASVTSSNLRINFTFTNNSTKDVWLKLQAASKDNDQKGIFLAKGAIYEMPTDNIYHGEISAIAASGSPVIYVTEF